MKNLSLPTTCIHSGAIADPITGGRISPIYPSSSYAYLDTEENIYPRYFNLPNQKVLEKKLSALEKGEAAVIFSSGMAAISTTLFSLLKKGDHAVFQEGLYGGTTHFILSTFQRFGIDYTITDGVAPADFERALRPNTKILYMESPSNPLLSIIDLSALAKLAKSKKLLTMSDNTFASPVNQNPIEFGIDIVAHSATKYLGGHSDLCAGAVISSKAIIEKVRTMAKNFGGSLNAVTCAQLERSLKTLAVRVEQQNENARALAEFLQNQEKVRKVFYPGLKDHPGHEIARKQMQGFGGMISFELSDKVDSKTFQKNLKLIFPALSLGGVESTICSPVLTSHAALSVEQRRKIGVTNSLLRLSVGLEDVDDLKADLEQALKRPTFAPYHNRPDTTRMLVGVKGLA